MRENAFFKIILQVFIYSSKLQHKRYDQCYAIHRKPKVSAFKWYIICENTFIFEKLTCKLLRKCQFFHIFRYALIHKLAFTFLNVTQN